jgi:hypothetical protein
MLKVAEEFSTLPWNDTVVGAVTTKLVVEKKHSVPQVIKKIRDQYLLNIVSRLGYRRKQST